MHVPGIYIQNNRPIPVTSSPLVVEGCRLVHALYVKGLIEVLLNFKSPIVRVNIVIILCACLFDCEHIGVGEFETRWGSKSAQNVDFSFPPSLSIALFLERSYDWPEAGLHLACFNHWEVEDFEFLASRLQIKLLLQTYCKYNEIRYNFFVRVLFVRQWSEFEVYITFMNYWRHLLWM